jgi:hypothetical protein
MILAVPRRAVDDDQLLLSGRLDLAAGPHPLRPAPARRAGRQSPRARRLPEGGASTPHELDRLTAGGADVTLGVIEVARTA